MQQPVDYIINDEPEFYEDKWSARPLWLAVIATGLMMLILLKSFIDAWPGLRALFGA